MRNSKNPATAPTMIQDNGNLHLLRKMNNETHSLSRSLIHTFNYVYQNAWMLRRNDVYFVSAYVCMCASSMRNLSRLPCHILSSSLVFFSFQFCSYFLQFMIMQKNMKRKTISHNKIRYAAECAACKKI